MITHTNLYHSFNYQIISFDFITINGTMRPQINKEHLAKVQKLTSKSKGWRINACLSL